MSAAIGRSGTLDHIGFVLRSNPVTAVAAAGMTALVLVAIAAPWLAPYDSIASNVSIALQAPTAAHWAGTDQLGKASGLPVPRYVSLKSDRVNLREGPAKDHRTTWIFQRAGLPVEITAEFETWRKVRDSEGSEGWVLHSLLSGRRTGLVTPWKKDAKTNPTSMLYQKPSETSNPMAALQPGVLANIRSCDKTWCRVNGDGFDGFIKQSDLWGVYPNEIVE